jgi:peptide chain release factor 1
MNDPDPELSEMFTAEHKSLCTQLDELVTERLPLLLLPTPAIATLPVIMSLNAGIGGAEAASCTDTLARMYLRFAQQQDWQTEIVSSVETTVGQGITGLREMTIRFLPPEWGGEEDAEVYGMLQWEKGVHRIQRIPLNDAQGRVQTSTVTIVVSRRKLSKLAQGSMTDQQVLPIYPDTPDAPLVEAKDVKTEVMRSRGAGGQVS